MNEVLKQRILHNKFTLRMRGEGVVDHDLYEQLCADLQLLEKEWKSVDAVDKQIMCTLYGIVPALQGSAIAFAKYNPEKSWEVQQMKNVIDDLIMRCLWDPAFAFQYFDQ